MATRLSFVNDWQLAVTPPHNALYVVFHMFLHIAYVGITMVLFIKRLRKHMTDALSTNDCATLHHKMATTGLAHWAILPLQFVTDDFLASIRERHWWCVFRKYTINDVPPRINRSRDSKKERGCLNKRVIAVLQGIKDVGHWMTTLE